jgi:hypothetical protein
MGRMGGTMGSNMGRMGVMMGSICGTGQANHENKRRT